MSGQHQHQHQQHHNNHHHNHHRRHHRHHSHRHHGHHGHHPHPHPHPLFLTSFAFNLLYQNRTVPCHVRSSLSLPLHLFIKLLLQASSTVQDCLRQEEGSSLKKLTPSRKYSYQKSRLLYGSVSKPCTPVVHIKIAGIYGCSSH